MKNFTCALLILLAFTQTLFAQSKTKRPNKPVRPAPTKQPAKEFIPPKREAETFGMAYEKYRADYEVNADGTYQSVIETQIRFHKEYLIERMSDYELEFNRDLQKVEVLEAYILKADGQKVEVPAASKKIRPTPLSEAAPGFSSINEVRIKFPNVQIRDAVCLKLKISEFKPYFQGQFNMLEAFPIVYDLNSIEINLTAPKNFPLFVQNVGFEGGKVGEEADKVRWQWRLKNRPAIPVEMFMTDLFSISPILAVTSNKDFTDLGAIFWSEAKKKAVVTPEVEALAQSLTKDLPTPEQKAYAIYEWVNKNIRYLSIILDRSGWIPHSTTEILANRYGDCKDYTIILYALLKAVNIESVPVLIRADDVDWFPQVASADFFNHMVLYIPALNLFADATAPNTRLGLIPQQIVGKKAVLAGEKTGLIETPKDDPQANRISSEVEINYTPEGNLKSVSKNVYNGRMELAFRPLFSNPEIMKNSGFVVKGLLAYYGLNGTGKILNIGNPFKVGEPFTIDLEIEIPNYTSFTWDGRIPLPIAVNLLSLMEYGRYTSDDERNSNLLIGAQNFRENLTLNFPAEVKIESLPLNVAFSNGVGTFRIDYVLENNRIKIVREMVINKDVISPKEYPLLRDLIAQAVDGYTHTIPFSMTRKIPRPKTAVQTKKPVRTKNLSYEEAMLEDLFDFKPLSRVQVTQFEAKIVKNPADIETRIKLLRHYYISDVKLTPAQKTVRLKHRQWFVENRPEMSDQETFGYSLPPENAEDPDFKALKSVWLKKLAENPTNSQIRLNAFEFFMNADRVEAEKILLEGRRIEPDNYQFPVKLAILAYTVIGELEDLQPLTAEEQQVLNDKLNENTAKIFDYGTAALELIKKERSDSRDAQRQVLLQKMLKPSFELGKFARTKSLATELLLDFGQNVNAFGFEDVTHFGNIYLGRAELAEGNVAKAKEYLLISIRAPLRKSENTLINFDLKLAAELLAKGEKETVLEYLKLCESLPFFTRFKTVYDKNLTKLKNWQEEIKRGNTPELKF